MILIIIVISNSNTAITATYVTAIIWSGTQPITAKTKPDSWKWLFTMKYMIDAEYFFHPFIQFTNYLDCGLRSAIDFGPDFIVLAAQNVAELLTKNTFSFSVELRLIGWFSQSASLHFIDFAGSFSLIAAQRFSFRFHLRSKLRAAP